MSSVWANINMFIVSVAVDDRVNSYKRMKNVIFHLGLRLLSLVLSMFEVFSLLDANV